MAGWFLLVLHLKSDENISTTPMHQCLILISLIPRGWTLWHPVPWDEWLLKQDGGRSVHWFCRSPDFLSTSSGKTFCSMVWCRHLGFQDEKSHHLNWFIDVSLQPPWGWHVLLIKLSLLLIAMRLGSDVHLPLGMKCLWSTYFSVCATNRSAFESSHYFGLSPNTWKSFTSPSFPSVSAGHCIFLYLANTKLR